MSKMSVSEAAARLSVSEARVRQRIDDGSLPAEKVGGRWILDLKSVEAAERPARGRPISPSSVWYSIAAIDGSSLIEGLRVSEAPRIDFEHLRVAWPSAAAELSAVSPASRSRAVKRLASALENADRGALFAWLRGRGDRRLYVAAPEDLPGVREDKRLLLSGVSHPDSGMVDVRVAEGYVAQEDLAGLVADHWLDAVGIDDEPNVVLHVVPVQPPRISSLLLAADLAEHRGPREMRRADELIGQVIEELRASR